MLKVKTWKQKVEFVQNFIIRGVSPASVMLGANSSATIECLSDHRNLKAQDRPT